MPSSSTGRTQRISESSGPPEAMEKLIMEPSSEKDMEISGGPVITLWGTVIVGCMGLAASVLLANTRNYLKPHG